jgi:ankyrin repeat protein
MPGLGFTCLLSEGLLRERRQWCCCYWTIGANIEIVSDYGRTALCYALEKGREAVVRLLVGRAANIEGANFGVNCMLRETRLSR